MSLVFMPSPDDEMTFIAKNTDHTVVVEIWQSKSAWSVGDEPYKMAVTEPNKDDYILRFWDWRTLLETLYEIERRYNL